MSTQQPQVPWLRYWGESSIAVHSQFQTDDAFGIAMATLNPNGERYILPEQYGKNLLACDPAQHADAKDIRDWLTATGRETRTPSEFDVIFWLAYFVRNEWAALPKRTRVEHKLLFERITTLCRELRDAMNVTGTLHLRGAGYGMRQISILDLLSDAEIHGFASWYNAACEKNTDSRPATADELRTFKFWNEFLSLHGLKCAAPTVQTLLDRLGSEAQRLEGLGPLHGQPTKRGAERGYFVRRIGELFQRRYDEQPHEVLAALTTIALGEATDRELVAKLLA